jgi:D-alanyl-D-alanine carboxypeptidase
MNKQALDHSVAYIKSWLEYRYGQEEIPGYVVAVSYKGEMLLNEAYGYANVENGTKMTTDHLFRIASHSKTFTATALMQLQEQGKLRLDDHVTQYVPWLKEHTDQRWQKVTLRQLMCHGAGIIRDGLNDDHWQLDKPFPDTEKLKELVMETDLIIDNNVKHKYSNLGYSILGQVVEAAAKMPYSQYVTENIIEPLGLKNTVPEYTPEIVGKMATGYTRRDLNKIRLPIAQADTHAMISATGFCSTAADVCIYFNAHFVGSGKLLDDESKKEMQREHLHAYTPGDDDFEAYGLGLDIKQVGKRRVIGHGGGFPGFITKTMADPKDELVVTVLTNCIGGPALVMVRGIYALIDYFQENTPDTPPKHDLLRLEGRYMNLWSMADIIVTGDKVISVYPNTWSPLNTIEKLEYVDDVTFKSVETGSFGYEGELVKFNLKDGKVETVLYNGSTSWPEAAWLDKLKDKKIIG